MKLKKILGILTLSALIALATFYLKNNLTEFKQLSVQNPYLIILLIILFILSYIAISAITIVLLKPLGINLNQKESFSLSIITGFYNLITPFRGGMAARAVYLKKKHNFSYTNFLSSLAASYVLIFLVAGISGLLSSYYIYKTSSQIYPIIPAIFLITTLSMSFIIIFSPKFKETKYNFLNKFIKVVNGWHLIKNNKSVIAKTIFLSLSQLILSSLMLYLQFRVFGININYFSVLFLSSINAIGLLIAITPAGLGISEAITVFSALTIGISTAESLSAALLGRFVSVVVLFILGPIFSYVLLKKPAGIVKEK